MISVQGMTFRSVRFIWAVALVMALAGATDSWAATKPAKPKITVQPAGQIVELDSSVNLLVAVTSSSAVSYQWRLNKVAIPGAQSASYVIDPVTVESAGKYDVVVTNAGGTVTSKQALLTVDLALPSLPDGTALYDEVTVRAMGQSNAATGGWSVAGSTGLIDPEDDTGSYTFTYKYVSVNRATLTVTGSFYDSDLGDRIGATATYTLVFTGVSPDGELECTCSGKGVYIAPAGYRPAKIPFTFSGTTSISLPSAPMSSSGSITLTGGSVTNFSGGYAMSGGTSAVTVSPVNLESPSDSSVSAGTLMMAVAAPTGFLTTGNAALTLGGSGTISTGGGDSAAGTLSLNPPGLVSSISGNGTLTFAMVTAADTFSGTTITFSGDGSASFLTTLSAAQLTEWPIDSSN